MPAPVLAEKDAKTIKSYGNERVHVIKGRFTPEMCKRYQLAQRIGSMTTLGRTLVCLRIPTSLQKDVNNATKCYNLCNFNIKNASTLGR